ncbi:MAG: hypothetical protein AAF940_09790 [Pseudomonadota bacterium]
MRRQRNESFLGGIARSIAGELATAFVWFIVAFGIGTLVAAGLCLYSGMPLIIAPIGGLVIAAIVAGLYLALRSSSIFDIFS